MKLGSRESRTAAESVDGMNPDFNEKLSFDYQGEEELLFQVRSSADESFVGEAKVSIPAVTQNGGSWRGNLELFNSNRKPCGTLNVEITVLGSSVATAPIETTISGAAPVLSGQQPVVVSALQPMVVSGQVMYAQQPQVVYAQQPQVVYARPPPTRVIYTSDTCHRRRFFGFW